MTQLLLHNARVILEGGVQRGGVLVRDGRIAHVFTDEKKPAGLSESESINLENDYLSPGLIDIHIHGSVGVDVQATDADGLDKLSNFLLSEGVTGYFATFVPTDERGYQEALASIRSYIERQNRPGSEKGQPQDARILGIHFEGPFVSENRCGALRREHFRAYDGDARSIDLFAGTHNGDVPGSLTRLMTLAPEIPGGLDLTRQLTRSDVRAFIGHSQAQPEILDLAVEAGARHITHFPNALDPLHHRKPGAVAWGLVCNDVTMDCIADLHHVHPLMLRLVYRSKGADRLALISDAIMPAGLGDGVFSVWGEKITVQNGRTALDRQPGEATIAGSVITMRQALRNVVDLGVPIHDAVRMASLVPARAAGLESAHGSILEGRRADLIAFDDAFTVRLSLMETLVKTRR
jgi:N-acetylglucosamine-6-phosphate deacetylase